MVFIYLILHYLTILNVNIECEGYIKNNIKPLMNDDEWNDRQPKQWMWRLHKNSTKPLMMTGMTAQPIACLEQELCHQCERSGFPFHTWVPKGNKTKKDLSRKKIEARYTTMCKKIGMPLLVNVNLNIW